MATVHDLDDALLVATTVHGNHRGFFCEIFRADALPGVAVAEYLVQDDHSRSRHGALGGLHFQIEERASRLVRYGRGRMLDIVVDLWRGAPATGPGRRAPQPREVADTLVCEYAR